MADALSKSKRVELDGKEDRGEKRGKEEQEVAVIMRSSIVLTEEIEMWKEAQENDPVIRDTI